MNSKFRLLLSAAFAVTATACNLEDTLPGLADSLLDPEASQIEAPGRKVAGGEFSQLELDASIAAGAQILALKRVSETETHLTIVPFDGGKACETGPAIAFSRLSSVIDLNLEGVVGYLAPEGEERSLNFADFKCQSVMPKVPGSPLPSVTYPRGEPEGFLSLTRAGQLFYLDITSRQNVVISNNVQSGQTDPEGLWTVEGGALVLRDRGFEEQARHGTDVGRFLSFAAEATNPYRVVYVDGGRLFGVNAGTGAEEALAEDVCRPISLAGPETRIAMFSPCTTRRLVLLKPNSDAAGATFERHTFAENTINLHQVRTLGDLGTTLLYLTNPDPEAKTGNLWLAQSGKEPVLIGEHARLDMNGRIIVDWDGTTGRLIDLELEFAEAQEPTLQGVVDVYRGVARVFSTRRLDVLANFDGTAGDWVQLEDGNGEPIEPVVLATGITPQRIASDPDNQRYAFVTDAQAGVGTLKVLDTGTNSVKTISDNVVLETARFMEEPNGIAYLTADAEDKPRALKAWLFDAELEVPISGAVAEYVPLAWPEPGILYVTTEAERQGIWFAKAR